MDLSLRIWSRIVVFNFVISSGGSQHPIDIFNRRQERSFGPSPVYIARYIYDMSQTRPITVSVDSTMTKLIFQVEANSGIPVIMATNAQGLPVKPKLNGSVSKVEGNITAADYGRKWTFMRLDRNIWDVTIMAESTVDFTYELIDASTGATWNENPIQGKKYKVQITVPNFTQLNRVAMAMIFVKESSMAKDMRPLSDKGGGHYEFTYVVRNMSFMIAIDGRDTAMHPVRRLSPNLVTPVNLKLIVPTYTGAVLNEGEQFLIEVTVVSLASEELAVDLRIADDKTFVQGPKFLSATIKPGRNWTCEIVLIGGVIGETTHVTITARPCYGYGKFGFGPTEVRRFTIYNNITCPGLIHCVNESNGSVLAVGNDSPINIEVIVPVSVGTFVAIAGLMGIGVFVRGNMRKAKPNTIKPQPRESNSD